MIKMQTISITNRKLSVDLLKLIGTLGVILAHVGAPQLIYHIRGFDVCLLVFASGITLKNHAKSISDYIEYLKKRFFRLIIPTWIFLLLFFILCLIIGQFVGKENSGLWIYSSSYYIRSFSFTGGIGYIWIFRVYMIMACMNPVITVVGENKKVQKWVLPIIIFLLVINEFMGEICEKFNNQLIKSLFQNLICYTLGYSIVELTAYIITRLRRNMQIINSIALCVLCVVI